MRLYILFLNCLFGCFLNGQPLMEVWYTSPIEKPDGGYAAAATYYALQCNAHQSLFIRHQSGRELEYDENSQKMAMHFAGGRNWLYKDNLRRLLTQLVTSFRDRTFLVEDQLHPINWTVLPDTKMIGQCMVQKARGKFHGRTYTAWFTRSVPISNGPWKLGGLPGLILEAYDDDKLVVFLFHSLRQIDGKKIEMPKEKARKVSLSRYQSIFQEEVKQYFDFLNARLKKEGSEVTYETGVFELWEYPE